MQIHPMTAEEALEYAPKAALLDFDGPITPDLIAALRDHFSYAISALAAVSAKLYEAEAAIVDLHTSNLELASLLQRHVEGSGPKLRKSMQNLAEIVSNGGIDPEYGVQLSLDDVDEIARESNRGFARRMEENALAQMSFDDVPSREPIEIIEAALDADPEMLRLPAHPFGRSTVEFRTDPGTYDANRGEIHRMLAEEIVAQFGNQPGADPEPEPS